MDTIVDSDSADTGSIPVRDTNLCAGENNAKKYILQKPFLHW